MATCVDAGRASYPSEANGAPTKPLQGQSLLPLISGKERRFNRSIYWEHEGNCAIRCGSWKAVRKYPGEWELYNMDEDRTELVDRRKDSPKIAGDMMADSADLGESQRRLGLENCFRTTGGPMKARRLIVLLSLGLALGQHGVIREYAALAPKPDAVPLQPLLDQLLTDTSITLGPDNAYYLTGSAVASDGPAFSHKIAIWRSTDMRKWARIREIDFAPAAVRAPEIHYLKDRFWLTVN